MSYIGNINIRSIYVTDIFNQSVTADEDIFPDYFSVKKQNLSSIGTYTIQCSFDKSGVLSLVSTRTVDGVVTTVSEAFEEGNKLNANGIYIFTFIVPEKTESCNIQYSVDANVNEAILLVHGGIY